MRVLIDIVHPAHVHFFRHMAVRLEEAGHEIRIVSREKDVTRHLLDAFGLDHVSVGAIRSGRLAQASELLRRDWALWRIARRFRPDVVLTRNPAGVQMARLYGALGVFDTDDGRAAGVHFRLAAPFARVITTPDCFTEDYGAKHRRYPAYKQCAYLHPELFSPDPAVRGELGLEEGERYAVVRFVAMSASHDSGERGLSPEARREVVRRLNEHGRVFVSSEADSEERWSAYRLDVSPDRLHDVIAHANLVVGDSQTVAAEAAVLGVPNFRVSSFSGRLPYLNELEERYQLTRSFRPEQEQDLLEALPAPDTANALRETYKQRLRALWQDKVNLVDWFVERVELGFDTAKEGDRDRSGKRSRPPVNARSS